MANTLKMVKIAGFILLLSKICLSQGNVGVAAQVAPAPTKSALPTAGNKGSIRYITDGNSGTDCVTGGGSTFVLCIDNGSVWTSLDSGSGGVPFSAVSAGTNANALVIGTGGSLTFSGTGTINANQLGGISIGTPTGTGNVVFSASPTFSGTETFANGTFDGGTIAAGTGVTLALTTPNSGSGNPTNINLSPGNYTGSGSFNGGGVTISGGTDGASGTGNGGNVNVSGGTANVNGGTVGSGQIILNGGNAGTTTGGAVAINAGNMGGGGTQTDLSGGSITVTSGNGTGAGAVSTIAFATPTALGSGTTQQSTATRFTITGVNLLIPSGDVLQWNADTGISRTGAAGLAFGNGTNGDFSATLKATTINAVTAVQLNGNAFSTITLKKGTGAGNYTSASTTYVVVDSSNLCFTVTIPSGFHLSVIVNGAIGTATGAVNASLALTDNAACSTANSGILVETTETTTGAGVLQPVSLGWVINGDGASHNIALQYKTSNGADSATLLNNSSTALPTMVFHLTP